MVESFEERMGGKEEKRQRKMDNPSSEFIVEREPRREMIAVKQCGLKGFHKEGISRICVLLGLI